MWESEGFKVCLNILLAVFTVYLFFLYFNIFFKNRKAKYRQVIGVFVIVIWLFEIPDIIYILPLELKLSLAVTVMMFGVTNIFEGNIWRKFFFLITFIAIWMMTETLVGNVLLIYCEYLANSILFGSLMSKFLFFLILLALKKVFTQGKISELSAGHSFLLILIPIGSIYVMDTVFMLAYQVQKKQSETMSLISSVILLLINQKNEFSL